MPGAKSRTSVRLLGYSAFLLLVFSCIQLKGQLTTDNFYRKPLKEVLDDIQKRYNVTIKYDSNLVANKWVNYADWRYRGDVNLTLNNVLSLLDMKVTKEKDNVYRVGNYEYYNWSVDEGWAELDRIASQYKTAAEWEKRKQELRNCFLETLQLSSIPVVPNSRPIITPQKKFNGYTIENIAIEILPGVWINGSLYKPDKYKGKIPVILNPEGHWEKQRYRPDCQYRCAAFAKMGGMAFSYDLFAWGESQLQFKFEDHRRSLALPIQVLGNIRILDYLLSLKDADTSRVGITGGSGGGTYSMLMTAIDSRIKVSAPIVMVSSYFYGGCPCETGMNIHSCVGRTNNVEIAAMAAPRPQLVVSVGGDWTNKMPEHDFIYLQKMYSWYSKKENVENVHLPDEGHDYGINKRTAVYNFMAKHLGLNLKAIQNDTGKIDESKITIVEAPDLYVFGEKGEKLPAHAVKGFENLEKLWKEITNKK